jgi:hypothetical protein
LAAPDQSYPRINSKLREQVIRFVGLAAGKTIKTTTFDGEELRRKVEETPAAGTAEGLSERSEAGLGEPSEFPSSSASCTPWISGNNCTQQETLIAAP